MGILNQNTPTFENWSWIFFQVKKFSNFSPTYSQLTFFKLIMTEVSENVQNIFGPKIPPLLNIEVGFFSDKKSFLQIGQICEK